MLNKALHQLADMYENGPPVFCFASLNKGNPKSGDKACVLGHMHFLIHTPEYSLANVAISLGHEDAYEFYVAISSSGKCISQMNQKEAAAAIRVYADTYHPVTLKEAA